MEEDLFSLGGDAPVPRTLSDRNRDHRAPLAVRMRPRTLEEIVGQSSALEPGSPLRRLVATDDSRTAPSSVIMWGPPGTGKTTLAYVVAQSGGREFVEISAVLAGVKEIREVVDQARSRLRTVGRETVLFVDEVHRFSKSQQDALLPSVENRWVTLIAATTENPYFSVISPLLSRSIVMTLEPLDREDLAALIERALTAEHGLDRAVTLTDEAREALLRLGGGDARKILTSLEAAAAAALMKDSAEIDAATLAQAVNRAAIRYDRAGDQHYDITSAFIKTRRGSDVDAALHYLARMIEAGEDPRFIARRLIVHASEDIGMADPTALPTAVAAAEAAQLIGLPEARIPLAQAVIHLATAPKSNSVMQAIAAAQEDIARGKIGHVPPHLRDGHYEGAKRLGSAVGYKFPHDDPRGVVAQQYLPQELADARYYQPTNHGAEKRIYEYLPRLRGIVRDEKNAGRSK